MSSSARVRDKSSVANQQASGSYQILQHWTPSHFAQQMQELEELMHRGTHPEVSCDCGETVTITREDLYRFGDPGSPDARAATYCDECYVPVAIPHRALVRSMEVSR